jgi:four helix bundle protein
MGSRIERFEDLIAWQKARVLVRRIYEVSRSGEFARDSGLTGQIRRAAVSVMSNIAEGFERAGRAEFHQFLVIAKGSCAEVRSQLYVAYDVGYIEQEIFLELNAMAMELGKIVGALRASVDRQRSKIQC